MKIVFIADAHLKGIDDPNQKSLSQFLSGVTGGTLLVILGDLFDYWSGYDEAAAREYGPLLEALKKLAAKGTKIIYLEGNHDFSMGPFFTDELGARVFAASHELSINGRRFFIAHGDKVSMGLGYALWRGFLRSPLCRLIVRIVPPETAWKIAQYLSARSRRRNDYKGVNSKVEEKLRAFAREKIAIGYYGVILAHSHVAGIHREDGGRGLYANPGSWADGSYLVCDDGEFKVVRCKG
ncbi:MAG: UDP-2,3-diacylglucosamine diphosphatase [Deltaproteobacteria bacterium]|nr:UDP-2,3-diacylglucosamine diphosphatase [Deltaproteobacteria bacterium]